MRQAIAVGQNNVLVALAVNFFKDDGAIIADCPALQLCTSGKNFTHAKRMFKEALDLWMETVLAMGTLDAALKELGWRNNRDAGCMTPKRTSYPPQQVNLLAQDYVSISLPRAA
ncbi:MAG TPA: hypothetical protein PKM88_09780 [bacterium]|nr:hypothetical protein [bacterium]